MQSLYIEFISYLHIMAVHQPQHNLLEEEARFRLSQALALPHIVQQRAPLSQLHHLIKAEPT